jgi:hypothetical protein
MCYIGTDKVRWRMKQGILANIEYAGSIFRVEVRRFSKFIGYIV